MKVRADLTGSYYMIWSAAIKNAGASLLMLELVLFGIAGICSLVMLLVWLATESLSRGICQRVRWGDQR